METLSLHDGSVSTHKFDTTTHSRRSPRLPTPETSRASCETFDRHGDALTGLKPGPYGAVTVPCSPDRANAQELSIRYQSAPHSPPYQDMEAAKPSLPPLRTIIAASISSPPHTPILTSASFQQGPCEPTVTNRTYKPPALYPNKKPKLEPVRDLLPPLAPLNQAGQDKDSLPPAERGNTNRRGSSSANPHPSRRYSVQYPGLTRRESSLNSPNCSPRFNEHGPPGYPQHANTSPRGHSREQPDNYASFLPKQVPYERHNSFVPSVGRDTDARLARYEETNSQKAFNLSDDRHLQYETCLGLETRTSSGYERRYDSTEHRDSVTPYSYLPDRRPSLAPPVHSHPLYEHGPSSAYFTHSEYEHAQTKVRKRSNLPKSSTEIMKTWFDQNIANPYPTEEQKAYFSRATGISMTQVSNWFINHRRRCPELRDKRDQLRRRDE